jgi:hypothetical protein
MSDPTISLLNVGVSFSRLFDGCLNTSILASMQLSRARRPNGDMYGLTKVGILIAYPLPRDLIPVAQATIVVETLS